MQNETPASQAAVHIASLCFLRPLGTCRGSGKEKTSRGRDRPSRGSSDSVNDKETGALLVAGGRGGCKRLGGRSKSCGGPESVESLATEGDRARVVCLNGTEEEEEEGLSLP